MSKMKLVVLLALSTAAAAICPARGAELPAALAATGTCHVVIVGGLPGNPIHARRFADWTKRFEAWCIDKAGMPRANVTVLSGDPQAKPLQASATHVLKLIDDEAGRLSPADTFVLFLAGHGDTADGEAVCPMPGGGLRVSELKAALARVPSHNQVLLLFGGASGDMLAELAAANRVIVAATSPGEPGDPVFAEFFLHVLESETAGSVSLLQAFNRASRDTAQWIRRISRTEGEAWHVEGQEAIRLFRKLCEDRPETPGARQLDPSSKPLTPDPDVPLKSVGSQAEAQQAGIPAGVRLITEHALLADAGHAAGVAAILPEGYVAVAGDQEGDPGFRAARVFIGKR